VEDSPLIHEATGGAGGVRNSCLDLGTGIMELMLPLQPGLVVTFSTADCRQVRTLS